MISVFKNEFFSLFRRMYAYITVSLTILLAGIVFTAYNLTYTSENILSVLSSMSVVVALVIPVIAVSVYPNRKRVNTDEIYDFMPLTSWHIVLGKYLAAFAVVMIPNILIAMFPAISGMFGIADHKASFAALLGFVLFQAAWLAICMFIASAAKSRTRAYIWCYALAVIWYFSTVLSAFIPKKSIFVYFEDIITSISLFSQLYKFTSGIFSLKGIVFYAVLTIAFVFFAWREHEKKYVPVSKTRAMNFKSAVSLLTAIVIAVSAFAVPLAVAAVPVEYMEFDTTQAGKNSVSNKAREFLQTVDKDVTIYILESTGLSDYELYLNKLAACNKKISLKKIYYSDNAEFYSDKGINTESISANSLVVECGENIYYVSYYNMFYYSNATLGASKMSYTEYRYYYSLFSSSEQYASYLETLVYDTVMYFDADKQICQYIEYATADIIPQNYYLVGHGEASIENSSHPYYGLGIKDLDISGGSIPEDAASIFINKPTSDINDIERDLLIKYLEGGGQLTFVTTEANLHMENLCSVLAKYGMSAQGIVKENIESEDSDGETTAETNFSPTVHTDNDILYYVQSSSFAPTVNNANAITVDEDMVKSKYLTDIKLMSSSDKAFIGDDSTKTATYTVACAVEAPSGARLVWFTGDTYDDVNNDAAMAVMYALGWVTLVFESNTDNLPAVLYAEPVTPITSGGARLLTIAMIVLPLAICAAGVITFYKRKKA